LELTEFERALYKCTKSKLERRMRCCSHKITQTCKSTGVYQNGTSLKNSHDAWIAYYNQMVTSTQQNIQSCTYGITANEPKVKRIAEKKEEWKKRPGNPPWDWIQAFPHPDNYYEFEHAEAYLENERHRLISLQKSEIEFKKLLDIMKAAVDPNIFPGTDKKKKTNREKKVGKKKEKLT